MFNPADGSLKEFGVSDGLEDVAVRREGHCAILKSGELLFCTTNGLLVFNPDSVKTLTYVPPVVITGINRFNKPVNLSTSPELLREMTFGNDESVFSIDYAALSYDMSEYNQYAYKLEGFDKDWVHCGNRQEATYTNLDPGTYTFRVKGSNHDGVWNEEGASIAVVITPPWWKTTWFTVFLWVSVAGSIGGTVRYVEMRKLRKQIELLEREQAVGRERARISQDMHDEVGAGLTEIGILSELAKTNIQNPAEAEIHMQGVSETSRETIASISEIIWAINPRNDLLDDLVAYLRHYTARYLGATGIALTFDIPETIPDFHLSAEARRNIFLVVKEAFHNIVKHSQATAVFMTISFAKQHLDILVKDNGRGFSAGVSGFGNGLRNMEKRMTDIGGTFAITSEPGEGTKVVIGVRL